MKKNRFFEKAEKALDISCGLLRNLPNITFYGTNLVEIDNFKGLLDFSETSLRINTSDSIIRLDGEELKIETITDDSLSVRGSLKALSFE